MRLQLLACGLGAMVAVQQAATPALTGSYEAVSTTAMAITGNLTLTDRGLTFTHDLRYETAAPTVMTATTEYGKGAGSLAALLGVPDDARMELRRVTRERVSLRARNGGLCMADRTTFLVIAAAPAVTGGQMLKIAAFNGAEPPGPTRAGAELCGTFAYMPVIANARLSLDPAGIRELGGIK